MKILLDIYYKIFVSSIITIQNSKFNGDIWKSMSLFYMSASMTLNIVLIWLIIQTHFYPGFTDFMYFEIIPENKYNALFNLLIYVFFPFITLNYFLIFHKKKYIKLIAKYPEARGKKISGIYLAFSWFGLGLYFLLVVI